jgi:hypothetical protein
MYMSKRIFSWGVIVGFLGLMGMSLGCGKSPAGPTALTVPLAVTPISPASAPGPTVAGERWNLTATVRSITGPEACISDAARLTIGQPVSWLITIQRSGESIHLSVTDADDPSDRLGEYDGAVVDGVLTADIKSTSGQTLCGHVRAESHVSGRFSGDGRVLTAENVNSFQLSSGETLLAYFDWSAARQ